MKFPPLTLLIGLLLICFTMPATVRAESRKPGTGITITRTMPDRKCATCKGTGKCKACMGTKEQPHQICKGTGRLNDGSHCFRCKGSGKVDCFHCQGSGSCTWCMGTGKD